MVFKIFGKRPTGDRLAQMKKSPHYKNNSFYNLNDTEIVLKQASYLKMLRDFLNKPTDAIPKHPLPSIKTDIKSQGSENPSIIWFGHSSYLIKCRNMNILVDPVLSGTASPISLFAKSFPGSDIYSTDDLPIIDILIITHDHYDHLDYKTIKSISNKTKHFYMPLGVGEHFEYWGISADKITEFDWEQHLRIEKDIELTATPARHFSGRSFTRNKTLWVSFVLKIFGYTIFIGGDSGYDSHFKEIGNAYGPFDIAMLETGQYNELWPYIHMTPEEAVMACMDLRSKVLLPIHWGKFALAYHPWNDPIERITKFALKKHVTVTTPMIGEPVILNTAYPQKKWWNF